MNLSIDHVVHVVESPEEAAKQFRDYGFHVRGGGEHLKWGTYNTLMYFDLTYVEFLGVKDRRTAERAFDNPLVRTALCDLARGPGFSQVALRTQEIDNLAGYLKENGFDVLGPVPCSRTTPDGRELRWHLLFPSVNRDVHLPFFIQWGQSDEERRRDMMANNIIGAHAQGDLRIADIRILTHNLTETAEVWAKLLQRQASPSFTDQTLGAECRIFLFDNQTITFCEPRGRGTVQDELRGCKERPMAVKIIGGRESWRRQVLGATYMLQGYDEL